MMLYIGIWVISAASLLFEVALLRVFSIALWYHFSFMVVSIALLGYGASGSFLMLSEKLREKSVYLFASALLFAIFAPLAYVVSNRIPFDPARLAWDINQILFIALYYIVLAIPFIFSGLTVALALTMMAERAGRVYAADLLGAGSGPVIALLLFPLIGGEGVVLASALGGFIAALFLLKWVVSRPPASPSPPSPPAPGGLNKGGRGGGGAGGGRRLALIPVLGILLIAVVFIARPAFMDVRVSPYKDLPFALKFSGAKLLDTRWNAYSRVDLIESPAVRFAPGLSLSYLEDLPAQRGITVDGDGLTAITRADPAGALRFLDFLPTALPYTLLPEAPDVFLIDTGGGLSILEALYHGAGSINGAEGNPLVAELANTAYSGFIYDRADIKTGEGRAILKGNEGGGARYDLIQLGVGSQTAARTGFTGLTEDYRFTVEAFADYHAHLKPGGYLLITRYLLPPPRGELKLVSTVVEAIETMGAMGPMAIDDPSQRLVIFRTLETFSILLKNGLFTEKELELVRQFLADRRFDAVHYPKMAPEEANRFNRFSEPFYYSTVAAIIDRDSRGRVEKDYLFDISPSVDDRPFFHHFFKLENIREVVESVGGKWQILLEGGYLLPLVFFQALVVSVLLIILPLFKRGGGMKAPEPTLSGLRPGPVLLYFFLLGIGFMFVEITLIQKFILFLDHPELAFSAVVSVLLISSGAGSFLSQRLGPERALKLSIPALVVLLIPFTFLLPRVLAASLGLAPAEKVLLTAVLISPLGILMGMPFPSAVRFIEALRGRSFVPWAWAVNGCASVLASIACFMAAMAVGFQGVLIFAALVYLAALGAINLAKKSPGQKKARAETRALRNYEA